MQVKPQSIAGQPPDLHAGARCRRAAGSQSPDGWQRRQTSVRTLYWAGPLGPRAPTHSAKINK